MSKKFTGITSAGSAIPVYDKDAHSALEQKLDTSAFSSVSGEFATIDDVVAAVSGKADVSAIPSLDGYATEEWVGEQGYLTEVPESAVSGFATHEEVESATSGAFPASAAGPLANSIMNGVTGSTVSYSMKPSADAIYASYNSLERVNSIGGSGLAINTSNLYINGVITATTGGLTAAGVSAGGYKIALSSNNATISAGEGHIDFTQNDAVSASLDYQGLQMTAVGNGSNPHYLHTFLSGGTNLGQVQVYSATNNSGAGFMIWASGARGFDASGNTLWDTTVAPLPNSLVGYGDTIATAGGLNGNIILTIHPKANTGPLSSAPNTVLNSYGLTASYGADAPSARVSPSQLNIDWKSAHLTADYTDVKVSTYTAWNDPDKKEWSLTGSVQKREIECDSATSAITAIAGSAIGGKEYSAGANIDITDEVISGKDWSEDIAAATSGLMETSGLEYDGDKISGYMGSAFAGGGEVPEGVMVESAVEYNAVNEISGYNGSAIAQYGAEKQWLVHDDTLVHASNSAQYALGVNLSALQRLMGIDETVLWEDTTAGVYNSTITLNEPWSGFNKIGIEVTDAFGWGGKSEQFNTLNLAENRVKNFSCSYQFIVAGSPNKQYIRGCQLTFANKEFISGTVISYESIFTPTSSFTCITGGSGPRLIRVIGIGRKA